MKQNKNPTAAASVPYKIVRVFEGDRTAAQVVADLVKVHNAV